MAILPKKQANISPLPNQAPDKASTRSAAEEQAMSAPVAGDQSEPLDDGLPDRSVFSGRRARRFLWIVAALALALRLVLLPIGHPWDTTTAYNMFIDIARGHSPYDTFRYLTDVAQSAHWATAYEYYAYPPMPLYLYFPLAKLFVLLHPQATYFFPVEGSSALPNLPWDFYALYKLPIWLADFGIAALLARMSGTLRGWRAYLLNPYVLLISGAWTFDAVMVLGLVLGVFWLQQGKMARSALALAFGTMVKYFPILVVPACALFLIKKKRPIRELVTFLSVYVVACLVLLGPYLKGLLYVLNFHAERQGGGMTWEVIFQYAQIWPKSWHVPATMGLAVADFGTPILAIVLLLTYWYVFTREMSLNRMVLITLLGFFIGSKLVNEQYALMLLPFAFIEAWQVGGAWRWFYRLFWMIPLAFAIMRVPIDHFLWLFYHTALGSRADVIATTQVTGLEGTLLPWTLPRVDVASIVLLGVGFFTLCVVAFLWPIRPPRRYQRKRAAAPLPATASAPALEAPPAVEASPQGS
jgi:hypothetical protein